MSKTADPSYAPRREVPRGSILVIDDEADCLEVLGELLSQDFDVRVANSGALAIEMATRGPLPDLIVTDILMPGMDGFEVKRRLSAHPRTRDVPVIFVSALGTAEDEKTAFELGAADYIIKPFRSTVVQARVRTQLELKRSRDILEHQKHSLEEAVSISHMNEARSRELNDMLSQSLADMEAFSYTVSHDLRAPLRLMDGFAEILKEEESERLSETGRQRLGSIQKAARQMDQMISDILAYSRAEHSRMECIPVALGPLVAEIVRDITPPYPTTETRIGTLPTIHGDPAMLRQIFTNLLGNAFKFSAHASSPCVSIDARTIEEGYEVTVRDNGAGFNPQYAPQLFALFSRLHSKSEFPGTGVGLAIVKRLLLRHGARITAASRPGHDTCFTIFFPART